MRIRPEDYAIHNAMEDVADQAIEQLLSEDGNACACLLCREDIKSQMLNRMHHRCYSLIGGKPKDVSDVLEDLETSLFNKVMLECYKAVIRVRENPRHDQGRASLNNTTEGILRFAVSEVLSNQKLILDRGDLSRLMAEALNGLKPSYTTTHKGDAFNRVAEMDPAHIAHVYAQIFSALECLQTDDCQTS